MLALTVTAPPAERPPPRKDAVLLMKSVALTVATPTEESPPPAKLAVFPDSSHGLSREGPPGLRVARLTLIRDWFLDKLTSNMDREPQEEQSAKANVE